MNDIHNKLSAELFHILLTLLSGLDLFNLKLTCSFFNDFIKDNRILHKEIYLAHYDDPSHTAEPDWEEELQQNVKLEQILRSDNVESKKEHLEFVADRVRRLMETASVDADESQNLALLNDYFNDRSGADNKNIFLCSSGLFDQGGTRSQQPAATLQARQKSAQLHCLWGRPIDPVPYTMRPSPRFGHIRLGRGILMREDSPAANTRSQQPDEIPVHMVARGKVYDLSEYTLSSLWGPFMEDGSHRTDWEKVEAIMVVLGFNLSRFTERSDGRFPYIWKDPWAGATPRSFISPPPPDDTSPPSFFDQLMEDSDDQQHPRPMKQPSPALESLDPYGVTGTWMRVVCFLDYNDLYHYNFHVSEFGSQGQNEEGSQEQHEERTFRRQHIDTEEGIIILAERLRVTRIEQPPEYEEEDWDEKPDPDFSNFKGTRLPIVHFTGDSRSLHASWDPNANSKIRGTVRQTPEGEIRWTTFSIFHGEERWRSEGIQVGGLKSARGVLGNWFDKDFDDHGPAGPTAFWKENDYLEEGRRNDGRVVAFF